MPRAPAEIDRGWPFSKTGGNMPFDRVADLQERKKGHNDRQAKRPEHAQKRIPPCGSDQDRGHREPGQRAHETHEP